MRWGDWGLRSRWNGSGVPALGCTGLQSSMELFQLGKLVRRAHPHQNSMSNTDQVQIFLSMFAMHLPTFIVCLVAGIVILGRRRQAFAASLWALLAFGLALFLCFANPLGQALLRRWVFESGETASRVWAFTAFGVFNSVLHAVIYAFLLMAILAGRSQPNPGTPPFSDRP
jgi:hypothetical protein